MKCEFFWYFVFWDFVLFLWSVILVVCEFWFKFVFFCFFVMVFFDLMLYLENVFVVGDGNFLFIFCLVFVLFNILVKIIVILLDLCFELEENDFVVKNIGKLLVYENVEILYEVDVIDFFKIFGLRVFD